MNEIWKDIKGYKGLYQISNLGNVKSLSRQHWNGTGWWTSKDRILVPRTSKNKNHYYSVQLVKDGVKKIRTSIGLWLNILYQIQRINQW